MEPKPTPPDQLPPQSISLDPLIQQVFEEIRAADAEIAELNRNLAAAREKLAAARGKMEILGQLQQLSQGPQVAQP